MADVPKKGLSRTVHIKNVQVKPPTNVPTSSYAQPKPVSRPSNANTPPRGGNNNNSNR